MAYGDYKNTLTSLNSGSTLSVQPAAGEQWETHNVFFGQKLEMKVVQNSNTLTIDNYDGSGSVEGMKFEVDNSHYLVLENTSSVSGLYGYEAVQTK